MTIEILFSEVCSLYGDSQNTEYLKATLPDAEFVFTALTDEPYFKDNTPDMIYIGAMSETTQRRVIEKLMPYKARIEELINNNTVILATGNAAEVFTKHISYVTEEIETDALGIFDMTVDTNLFRRYNGKVLGTTDGLEITGFRSQFSFMYGDNSNCGFLQVVRGDGINKESKIEGIRKNKFIGTSLLGPILPLNPLFTEYLISLTGNNADAAYRDAAMAAYNQRLKEFKDPSTVFGNNH